MYIWKGSSQVPQVYDKYVKIAGMRHLLSVYKSMA